ncbi:unnamed protein product [Cochlearia groenlandica]
MPRIMWKSFHLCLPSNITKPSPPSAAVISSSTASSDDDLNHPSIPLINNFNLLYDDSIATNRHISKPLVDVAPFSSATTLTASASSAANSSSSSYTSFDDNYGFTPEDSPPPDLTAVLASRRFFFSSPGRSNSITDSPDLLCRHNYETATTTTDNTILTGGNAVKLYVHSPDPYNDFRRSMQEMLDAVTNVGDIRRYEFLHELLLSYLSLNENDTHKFIISAFADILVSLSYRTTIAG